MNCVLPFIYIYIYKTETVDVAAKTNFLPTLPKVFFRLLSGSSVGVIDTLSCPLKADCRPLPLSTPLSIVLAIDGVVSLRLFVPAGGI